MSLAFIVSFHNLRAINILSFASCFIPFFNLVHGFYTDIIGSQLYHTFPSHFTMMMPELLSRRCSDAPLADFCKSLLLSHGNPCKRLLLIVPAGSSPSFLRYIITSSVVNQLSKKTLCPTCLGSSTQSLATTGALFC